MHIEVDDDEQPEIGLIALIDCIFFLLMFFMVATSFKQKEQAHMEKHLPITLPQAKASLDMGRAAPNPLVIRVDRSGNVAVDERELSLDALHARLRAEAARNPARPVRIDGDGSAAYQSIVQVLDLCQFVGLTTISMHTRRQ